MPLLDVEFMDCSSALPADVTSFLREAESRISQYVMRNPVSVSGFVPSDFEAVYRVLHAISLSNLATGKALCEWGSGFGVVASMAAMLEYAATGIEIDGELVDESRQLAADYDLPAEFIHGSFIPPNGSAHADAAYADNSAELSWMVTDEDDAYGKLGLDADDFDVIFAYPWPGEEHVIDRLFERFGADGALLLTYSDLDEVRLRRKIGQRSHHR